jgi:hypothetical protein
MQRAILMRQHTTICDKCKEEIDERKVWILKCPPDYKGIDYDLCFDCVNEIMGLGKSFTLGDMAAKMAGKQYGAYHGTNQGY